MFATTRRYYNILLLVKWGPGLLGCQFTCINLVRYRNYLSIDDCTKFVRYCSMILVFDLTKFVRSCTQCEDTDSFSCFVKTGYWMGIVSPLTGDITCWNELLLGFPSSFRSVMVLPFGGWIMFPITMDVSVSSHIL